MKFLIAARHGQYGVRDLDQSGVKQIQLLAQKILTYVETGDEIIVLSSVMPRAMQSASIIGEVLGTEPILSDALSYSGNWADGELLMRGILEDCGNAHIVITIGHEEAPSGQVNATRQKHFGKGFKRTEIQTGTALVLNMKNGEVTKIP